MAGEVNNNRPSQPPPAKPASPPPSSPPPAARTTTTEAPKETPKTPQDKGPESKEIEDLKKEVAENEEQIKKLLEEIEELKKNKEKEEEAKAAEKGGGCCGGGDKKPGEAGGEKPQEVGGPQQAGNPNDPLQQLEQEAQALIAMDQAQSQQGCGPMGQGQDGGQIQAAAGQYKQKYDQLWQQAAQRMQQQQGGGGPQNLAGGLNGGQGVQGLNGMGGPQGMQQQPPPLGQLTGKPILDQGYQVAQKYTGGGQIGMQQLGVAINQLLGGGQRV